MRYLWSAVAGVLFAVGLIISGMHDPAVVLGFLDVFGNWNPALALVMAGALTVTFVGYRVALSSAKPVFAETFALPTRKDIDPRLVMGAALFGVGWGLVGLCPGPALIAVASKPMASAPFFIALLAGLYAPRLLDSLQARSGGVTTGSGA